MRLHLRLNMSMLARRGLNHMMAVGIELANKREQLCTSHVSCPRCKTYQVQLVDTEKQEWKCRECRFKFDTQFVF